MRHQYLAINIEIGLRWEKRQNSMENWLKQKRIMWTRLTTDKNLKQIKKRIWILKDPGMVHIWSHREGW